MKVELARILENALCRSPSWWKKHVRIHRAFGCLACGEDALDRKFGLELSLWHGEPFGREAQTSWNSNSDSNGNSNGNGSSNSKSKSNRNSNSK